jgi:hypothetical protein
MRERCARNVERDRALAFGDIENSVHRDIENGGAGSTNRRMSQGHAMRSIFGRSRVTHFVEC